MHTYRRFRQSKDTLPVYQVGYWTPKKRWETVQTLEKEFEAIVLTHYLNGGSYVRRLDLLLIELEKRTEEKNKVEKPSNEVKNLIGKTIKIDHV